MLVGDGVNEWYTVIGIWAETMERWAESYFVDTALAAEEAAQKHASTEKFLTLMVAGVLKGKIHVDVEIADGYAQFVDPHCKRQEEMTAVMQEIGYWTKGYLYNEINTPKKKGWFKG